MRMPKGEEGRSWVPHAPSVIRPWGRGRKCPSIQ